MTMVGTTHWPPSQDDANNEPKTLLTELKRRRENKAKFLEGMKAAEQELADLDRAIAALEAPAQPLDELRSVPGAEEEVRDHLIDAQTSEQVDPRVSWKAEPEIPEGGDQLTAQQSTPERIAAFIASQQPASVEIEPVLDATSLPQVTPDEVPPTAEVIHTDDGRKRFALFGGQTHEVVSASSNPDADFWAKALHPKPKVDA